jgi:Terminase large subunit, T4likevirus-type, N-terminal
LVVIRALARRIDVLERLFTARRQNNTVLLDELRAEPDRLMSISGMPPDPWQSELLQTEAERMLLLCSRQAGKSTVAAALALRVALMQPGSPILILSPTDRQSGELFRKILASYRALDRPVAASAETVHQLQLANGSRILSLPGTEKTVRCYSGVALLIIDEAARVDDALYRAVRPMLAVSKGRLIALSTPFGKRGWFHDAWHSNEPWQRLRITADECPRITREFLAEERRALGDRWYRQEYLCSFEDVVDAVFAYSDIQAALRDDVKPLFAESMP